jgi:hypothetical protein
MIVCDLCGQSKVRVQKEIDGREYDICTDSSNPFTQKLITCKYVPTLHNPAILVQAKGVGPCIVVISGPTHITVHDDILSFRENPFEFGPRAGYSLAIRSK